MPVGVCLACGFLNRPAVDPQKEQQERQRKAREEREAQARAEVQTALDQLDRALQLAQSGDLAEATRTWHAVRNEHPDVARQRLRVEAELWRFKDVPEKRQKALEQLVEQLPFDEKHLQERYELACLYEETGSPGKAFRLLKQFLDQGYDWYRDDILSRWRRLKEAGVTGGAHESDAGAYRVRVGAMDRTVESVRAWIDEATRSRGYFSDSILLNDDFKEPLAIDRAASTKPAAAELTSELNDALRRTGFAGEYRAVEQRIALQHEAGLPGGDTPVLLIRSTGPGPLWFDMGAVNLAVHVIERGRAGVSLAYYELFTPHDPEELPGKQPDARSFNDAVLDALLRLQQPDPARQERLRTLREQVVRQSVERLLERGGLGAADLMF